MKDLDEILLFDPSLEAEKVTGASYKYDDDTMKLGCFCAPKACHGGALAKAGRTCAENIKKH